MLLLILLLLAAGCERASSAAAPDAPRQAQPAVRSGAEVLAGRGFDLLRGRRVGLVTNHTAMVGGRHLIDFLHEAPEVTLVALFGPEHGLRGLADAGAKLEDGKDPQTGVPVYSLYGQTLRPTPEMLRGVDVLVFDIQDVGARFYTYISTMGYAMQAAAEQGIPFVVLDRPNPLGGALVSGFLLEAGRESFVGLYPIPVAHGLTVGELARMIRGERMLPGLEELRLEVVPAEGWRRGMLWPGTGLPWIKTSPNIPDFETALVYPGTCFFEGVSASEGRGTTEPFRLLGAPWADGRRLADTLNARGLPGLRFEAASFTPRSLSGMSANPKLQDVPLQGVRVSVTDAGAVRPVEAGVHLLHAFYQQAPADARADFFNSAGLARLAGTDRLERMLRENARPEAIIASWQAPVAAFERARAKYLLYE